jgi:hypothetical protein
MVTGAFTIFIGIETMFIRVLSLADRAAGRWIIDFLCVAQYIFGIAQFLPSSTGA